jgi:uncharacterized protein YcbK (DUF882 family)
MPSAPKPLVLDRITPHFRLAEFTSHDGTPVPVSAHEALMDLCRRYLEPLRARFGRCLVLSGYRHAAYNRRIGGAPRSRHVYDEHPGSAAADVRFQRGTTEQWYEAADALARANGHGGVGKYLDSAFIHVDNRPGQARWSGWQGGR